MVYNDRPDPELNGLAFPPRESASKRSFEHWLGEEDTKLIFWVFGISTVIGLGIIYLVVP